MISIILWSTLQIALVVCPCVVALWPGYHHALALGWELSGSAYPLVLPGENVLARPQETMRLTKIEGVSGSSPTLGAGAPDEFGYTWTAQPFDWIDARSGRAEPGWNKYSPTAAGPFDLTFPFKFYDKTYRQYWIGSGFVALQDAAEWSAPADIPSPSGPDSIIAPYASMLDLDDRSEPYHIYHKSGGSAPNRYLVVEWYKLRSGPFYNPDSELTFELVLYENGDIVFQYLEMKYSGRDDWCGATGIEDSSGYYGLNINGIDCSSIGGDQSIYIKRPPASARTLIEPPNQGRLIQPNTQESFDLVVRNNGDIGSDTYNLEVDTTWPALFTDSIGAALVDSNGDGWVDTGSISAGDVRKIRVTVQSPAFTNPGATNLAIVTARSVHDATRQDSAYISTSYGAPFAEAYGDYGVNQNGIGLAIVDRGLTRIYPPGPTWGNGDRVSATVLADGSIFLTWFEIRYPSRFMIAEEIFGALYDKNGEVIVPANRLTFTQPEEMVISSFIDDLAVASTPDGQIGIQFVCTVNRIGFTGDYENNVNVMFMSFHAGNALANPPFKLTDNQLWGWPSDPHWTEFYGAKLTSTPDNRFVAMMIQKDWRDGRSYDNLYYAALNSTGEVLKPPTLYSGEYSPDVTRHATISTLDDGRVALLYTGINGLSRALLDSGGTLLSGEVVLAGNRAQELDSISLTNGRTLVAWVQRNTERQKYELYTMLLEKGTLATVTEPAPFTISGTWSGDRFPSITHDQGGHGIVTWMEADTTLWRWIYYALIDDDGAVLTQPMPVIVSEASDYDRPAIRPNIIGYGTVPLLAVNPTTDEQDAYVTASTLAAGTPGGVAFAILEVGNVGRERVKGATLRLTLNDGISVVSSNPAPNGVLIGATEVAWSLPELEFQGVGRILVYLRIPDVPIGARFKISATIEAPDDEIGGNNVATLQVMAAKQVHLPELKR